jgi:hypothetical protein
MKILKRVAIGLALAIWALSFALPGNAIGKVDFRRDI